jgi:hypothetical protein
VQATENLNWTLSWLVWRPLARIDRVSETAALSPKIVQVAEVIGDTQVLLMDLVIAFYHATGVKLV